VTITIVCSARAVPLAEQWKQRFRRNFGALVEIVSGLPACEAAEEGAGKDAVIVLLDGENAPEPFVLSDWKAMLQRVAFAYVRLEACGYPALLERRATFFGEPDERRLEQWLIGLLPDRLRPPLEARGLTVPSAWWLSLVDRPGRIDVEADEIETVRQFATDAGAHFQGVAWIVCGDRSMRAVEGEIEHAVGGSRMLVIVSHVTPDEFVELPRGFHSLIVIRGYARAFEISHPPEALALRKDPARHFAHVAAVPDIERWLFELPVAMEHGLADVAYHRAIRFLTAAGRKQEAVELLKELKRGAERWGDSEVAAEAEDRLHWLTDSGGVRKVIDDSAQQQTLF